MQTIPLTVLAYEGPSSRSYLALMEQAGYRPDRIVAIVLTHGVKGGKRIGRWMPEFIREPYATRLQEHEMMYWPRHIRKQYPGLYSAVIDGLSSAIDNPGTIVDRITGSFSWADYVDTVERVSVRDLSDLKLKSALEGPSGDSSPTTVLYTGGGIVPASLLRSDSLRFLHVHPARSPGIRGADGILWSILLRGRTSATCFYMNEGIDTGEIIETRDFPSISFNLGSDERPGDDVLYRSLFSYYDPIVRALLFADILKGHSGQIPTHGAKQSATDGVTFHFMHSRLRSHALGKIFT